MNFALRYIGKTMLGAFKGVWKFLLVFELFLVAVLIAYIVSGGRESIGEFVLTVILMPFVMIAVGGLPIVLLLFGRKYKVYKIRDEKGFCLEYFYAFEKEFIRNKPKVITDYIEFAEIYQQLGDYESAMAVLNTLKIPESDIPNRISYIFVYMNTALYMGNSALADDIWRYNHKFINSKALRFVYGGSFQGLDLMTATADCLARRYERALGICNYAIDKWRGEYTVAFYTLRVYIYKMLSDENRFVMALAEAQAEVQKSNPVFESDKRLQRRELEKAARGELPL